MEYSYTYPYLTPDEIELVEMYRKLTPETKAEVDKRLLLMLVGDEEDDNDLFPSLNMNM